MRSRPKSCPIVKGRSDALNEVTKYNVFDSCRGCLVLCLYTSIETRLYRRCRDIGSNLAVIILIDPDYCSMIRLIPVDEIRNYSATVLPPVDAI